MQYSYKLLNCDNNRNGLVTADKIELLKMQTVNKVTELVILWKSSKKEGNKRINYSPEFASESVGSVLKDYQ